MSTYQLYTYDVWGNEEDGFEVNDVFKTGETYTFSTDEPTNEEICKALELQIPAEQVRIDAYEDVMYLTNDMTGKPFCELRLIAD